MLRNVPVGAGRRKNKNGCAPPTSPVPPGGSGPVPMAELTSLPMAGGMPINCQTLAMQHAHAVMAAAQAHPNCKRETLSRTSTVSLGDGALRLLVLGWCEMTIEVFCGDGCRCLESGAFS